MGEGGDRKGKGKIDKTSPKIYYRPKGVEEGESGTQKGTAKAIKVEE
jgi:hypothetical protein